MSSLRRAFASQAGVLTDLAVPKTRRPKFDLHLRIHDLNNVPLVSGTSFVKWHLPHSTAAEHRGRTAKAPIKDHKVSYDYAITLPVRLTVDKNGLLQESWIHFEVLQEYSAGGRGERIVLGNIRLNLAEYVEASEGLRESAARGKGDGAGQQAGEEEGVCRRYLMKDSKINSTLKVSILMHQTEGDRNFTAPPLKSAPVFGGIAGIISAPDAPDTSSDPSASTINNNAPSLSSASRREAGELQDMYRRTLAAYWAAQPGELKADECIEDIFAGGDGWGDRHKPYSAALLQVEKPMAGRLAAGMAGRDDSSRSSDSSPGPFGRKDRKHERVASGDSGLFRRGADSRPRSSGQGGMKKGDVGQMGAGGAIKGRASLEQQANQLKAGAEGQGHKHVKEVDEFEIREDLRSWRLPT